MIDPAGVFVVIPAYNEAASIEPLLRRTMAVTGNVIVVDDGSIDRTAEIVSGRPVTLIRHETNRRKGAGLLTGFRAALDAGAQAVVTLDGDGQHEPERIPAFVARANELPGCIVAGCRLHDRAAIPASRYRANRVANFWISWAAGHRIDDTQCGMRLYPRAVLEKICAKPRQMPGFAFESEVLIDAARDGFPTVSVRIPALYDGHVQRPSHFRPVRDIASIVGMVAGKLLAHGMYPAGLIASLRKSGPSDA